MGPAGFSWQRGPRLWWVMCIPVDPKAWAGWAWASYRAGQDGNETKLFSLPLSALIYKGHTHTQILKSPIREGDGKCNVYWMDVEVNRFSFLLSTVCVTRSRILDSSPIFQSEQKSFHVLWTQFCRLYHVRAHGDFLHLLWWGCSSLLTARMLQIVYTTPRARMLQVVHMLPVPLDHPQQPYELIRIIHLIF